MNAGHDDVDAFRVEARRWLTNNATQVAGDTEPNPWGTGSDDVAIFHAMSDAAERSLLQRAMDWQQAKFDAGFGAIQWPIELGGAGLTAAHDEAFETEQAAFVTPGHHEVLSVTLHLVAPTLRVFGTPYQRQTVLPKLLRTEELCCQLFSEPGAGSDLAAVATRAAFDGDEWVVNGQKTWTSGARFSKWGELICRTDPSVPKHAGMTAFLVPMDAPGVIVVPIRQMSGGSSFNEVYFDDVRIPDRLRLGDVGEGWRVALTTLGFERGISGSEQGEQTVGGTWSQVRSLADWLGVNSHPMHRQELAKLYSLDQIRRFTNARSATLTRSGGAPGPEASAAKLMWTQWLEAVGRVTARMLGSRITADTGEWGTFAWTDHLLGAPGYRIAGGSDEIQRNIIGERVLGLPSEPRVDRDVPFSQITRHTRP